MMKVKTESDLPPASRYRGDNCRRPGGESFSLAHLSDLHLTTLENAKITQLLNKRLLGYFSWRRKRRIVHSRAIIDALLEDLRLTRPDHVAVTGDLTHLGLPEEFAEAGRWLPVLGTPDQVTVIPGNHEAYTGSAWSRSCAMWAPYLASDDPRVPARRFLPESAGSRPGRPDRSLLGNRPAPHISRLAALAKNSWPGWVTCWKRRAGKDSCGSSSSITLPSRALPNGASAWSTARPSRRFSPATGRN